MDQEILEAVSQGGCNFVGVEVILMVQEKEKLGKESVHK